MVFVCRWRVGPPGGSRGLRRALRAGGAARCATSPAWPAAPPPTTCPTALRHSRRTAVLQPAWCSSAAPPTTCLHTSSTKQRTFQPTSQESDVPRFERWRASIPRRSMAMGTGKEIHLVRWESGRSGQERCVPLQFSPSDLRSVALHFFESWDLKQVLSLSQTTNDTRTIQWLQYLQKSVNF